jgi:hypothetical protein
VLKLLSQSWEDLGDDLDYETLAAPLQAGLANLGKWYRRTDESDAYFIIMGKYLRTELFMAHVANATMNLCLSLILQSNLLTLSENGNQKITRLALRSSSQRYALDHTHFA